MPNRAFWRAIHSLAHPISICAVILLLLNDHYLRHTYPSWLTGKLGDFSWLIFAPFTCAAVIAWIVPHHLPQQEKWVAWISFGFIGLWFATAKTIPLIHEITLDVLEKIIGWRGTLRLDVTDLFTLPVLLIGWYIWRNVPNMPLKLAPRAWVILALGLVGTLASTDPYYPQNNKGIDCIDQEGSRLKAVVHIGSYNPPQENYDVFTSTDGGLSWNLEQLRYDSGPGYSNITLPVEEQLKFACVEQVSQVVDPANSQIQYRFQSGEAIEKSVVVRW